MANVDNLPLVIAGLHKLRSSLVLRPRPRSTTYRSLYGLVGPDVTLHCVAQQSRPAESFSDAYLMELSLLLSAAIDPMVRDHLAFRPEQRPWPMGERGANIRNQGKQALRQVHSCSRHWPEEDREIEAAT